MSAFLICPCCLSTWATYNELVFHCRGQKFNLVFTCKQPGCGENFLSHELDKYLDHVYGMHTPKMNHCPPAMLKCACCSRLWAAYNELVKHVQGQQFSTVFYCKQAGCNEPFLNGEIYKYLEHMQRVHAVNY